MPTISMREGDEDYAISFAVPTDSEGHHPDLRPSVLRHPQD